MSGENWADAEGVMLGYLKADADVIGSLAGTRVWLAMAKRPVFPNITIIRVSGGEHPSSEVPAETVLFQIDVRGRVGALSEADTVRQAVRKALSKLRGARVTVTGKGAIYSAVVQDDRRLPETQQQDEDGEVGERPRYILTVQAVVSA